jgi:hypothetical protein
MTIYKRYNSSKQRTVPLGHGQWITSTDLILIANALPTRSRSKGYRYVGHTFRAMLGDTPSELTRRFELIEYKGSLLLASWEGEKAWLPTLTLIQPLQFRALIDQYKADPRWKKVA